MALLIYLLPALLFAAIQANHSEDAARLRFGLLGFGFRGGEGKAFEVNVGSNYDKDEIWIANLPMVGRNVVGGVGRLKFQPADAQIVGGIDERPPGFLTFELGKAASQVGLIGIRDNEGPLRLVGALDLEHNDLLEIEGRGWVVNFENRLIGPRKETLTPREKGQLVLLPERESDLPFVPWDLNTWRSLGVDRLTYPLSWIANEDTFASFLFRQPLVLAQRRLSVMPLDPELSVWRAGKPLEIRKNVSLAAGDRLHVLGLPRPSASSEQGGVRDLRSFRFFPGIRSFVATLDTPEVHSLSRLDLLRLESRSSEEADTGQGPLVNLAMGDWQITDEYLHFRHASHVVASQAFATVELPESWRHRFTSVASLRFATPQGQWQLPLGQAFWLGDAAKAALQIDLLRPPLFLGLLTVFLAVFKAIAGRAVGLSVSHLFVFGGVELLVLWRVVLAWRAWALDPFAEEAMVLALVAWALLPWCLVVASMPPTGRRLATYLPALGGWCFSLAWCLQLGAELRPVWLVCHFSALAVPIMRRYLPESIVLRLWRPWPRSARGQRALFCFLAVLPILLRLSLVLFGFRESVQVGSRISLSLVHIPAGLLLEAAYLIWLWRRAQDNEFSFSDLLPGVMIAVGIWLLPAGIASDLGLALLNLPIWLFVLTWLAFASDVRRPGGQRFFLALVFLLYLTVAALPLGARAVLSLLPDTAHLTLSSERNYLRILEFAYPEKLRDLGVSSSEDMVIMISTMQSYTTGSHALWGRGYTRSELSRQLGATVLREHVVAVLVAAEWGLLGTLCLALAYCLVGLGGASAAPFRSWWRQVAKESSQIVPIASTLATLATLTLAFSSLYMILANYGLVLFTGKNTYLLGLDSAGDVLESYLLLFIASVGLAISRDRTW